MIIYSIIENLSDEYGGPAVSLPELLNSVEKHNGVNTVILSTKYSNEESNTLVSKYGLHWETFPIVGPKRLAFSPMLLLRLLKIKNSEPNIIFSNNLWNFTALISFIYSLLFKKKHIISVRGSLYPWSLSQSKLKKKIAWFLFQRSALNNASAIHVTCQDELDAVKGLGIRAPIALIPHGISIPMAKEVFNKTEACNNLGIDPSKKYILFLSRLHKKKGLDLLLEAWSNLALGPEWNLIIAGPDYGQYEEKINNLRNSNKIENVIHFPMLKGVQKASAFCCSSFFVLPTYSENFGIVIGESLSYGLPVITTGNAPWQDVVTYNCGKIVDCQVDELSNAIKSLSDVSEQELKLMGANARKLIKEKYSWHNRSNDFQELMLYLKNGIASRIIK